MFKIELRKSIGLDEDIVEGMCLVSLVVIKAQKIAPLSLDLCRKDANTKQLNDFLEILYFL
ncbi:hypothetical protein [Staphylococcus aureus]|uniref:hypothetical protein n=1 Tax=Staphylococcus aureus TaxID=1280 RepID=UPI0039793984